MSITFQACKQFGDDLRGVVGSPELNVANGNAGHIFKTLGVHPEYCGVIDAGVLLDKIESCIPETCERQPTSEGRVFDMGIGSDQADRYFKTLTDIAFFAMENECQVAWS